MIDDQKGEDDRLVAEACHGDGKARGGARDRVVAYVYKLGQRRSRMKEEERTGSASRSRRGFTRGR